MRPERLALLLAAAAMAGCGGSWRSQDIGPLAARQVSPADHAAFHEALALTGELKYAEAAEVFARLIGPLEAAGDHQLAGESMFWLGFCHEKLQQRPLAERFYTRLMDRYPHSPAANMAAQRLQRMDMPPP